MSEGSLTQVVADEVNDQIGLEELLGDGSIEDELDGDALGAAVGRQFGERLGRELGAAVGRNLQETLSTELDDEGIDRETLRTELTTAVRDGIGQALEDSSARDALESVARSVTDESTLEGMVGEDEETDGEETEDEEGADEPEEEAEGKDETEGEEAEEEEGADETPEADEHDAEPSAADLEDLRRETLEDFLGVMAYEDLQSVAKDVDVKANLSREEMTERIVETVTEGDESEAQEADAE